ncbi:MAG: sulfotransferase family 2 domain-containing protein [Candidatus Hodarchaeales archaeon]|jgi:hypothetical protein
MFDDIKWKYKNLDIQCEGTKEFIRVHVPRVAGTTIGKLLGLLSPPLYFSSYSHEKYDLRKKIGDHPTAVELKEELGDLWNTSVSFAFVRNPWDRKVSEWCERKRYRVGLYVDTIIAQQGFNHWVRYWYNKRHEKTNHYHIGSYPLDGWSFITEDDNIIVDFVGFYERLYVDFSALCRYLNIDYVKLVTLETAKSLSPEDKKRRYWHLCKDRIGKERKKIPYQDFYDKDTIQMVAEMDAKEIEYFGYDFENVVDKKADSILARSWK